MRQSLSEPNATPRPAVDDRPVRYAVLAAVALSFVLVAAAVVDQAGTRSLVEHAEAMYAPFGKQPSAGLLYGLVYGISAANVLLWLLVRRVARSPRRVGVAVLAAFVTLAGAGMGVLLLATGEYGQAIFPPLWGVLALLPAVAGVAAILSLVRPERS
jgi:hypothetical protein